MPIDWKKISYLYHDGENAFNQMQRLLQESVRLTFPGRNYFYQYYPDSGRDTQTYVFDNTARLAANTFVNSLNELLFPLQFFSFEVGENVPITKKSQLKTELNRLTDEYHRLLAQTYYKVSVNESLKDATISTGFIEIRENSLSNKLTHPVSFHSAPLCKVYFTEQNDLIVNTWRENEAFFYLTKQKFPFVDWDKISYKDNDLVNIIDGCVYYPEAEDDPNPFIFYIMDKKNTEKPLYWEKRSYPSRFGFGMDKFAIGSYREGQVLKILPSIRMANAVSEMNWIAIQYNSMPITLYRPEMFENPAMLRLTPGANVKLNRYTDRPGQASLQPAFQMPVNVNSQNSQLQLSELQDAIKMALFAFPVPSSSSKVRTATEIDALENAKQKGINRIARRLKGELLDQFIKYSIKAFRRQGYLVRDNPKQTLEIDGENIYIKYSNIFTQADNMNIVKNLDTYREIIQGWVGPQYALSTIDIAKLPQAISKLLNLPIDLVQSEAKVKKLLDNMQQTLQNAQQANQKQSQIQQNQQPPPSGNNNPANPLAAMGAQS